MNCFYVIFLFFFLLFQNISAQEVFENSSHISMSNLQTVFENVSERDLEVLTKKYPEFQEDFEQTLGRKKECSLRGPIILPKAMVGFFAENPTIACATVSLWIIIFFCCVGLGICNCDSDMQRGSLDGDSPDGSLV